MNDDHLARRLEEWLRSLELPFLAELRCKGEVIDAVEVGPDSKLDEVAIEIVEESLDDATAEGKNRSYNVVAILPNTERHICPLSIRRRVNPKANNLVETLAKTTVELVDIVRKERKESLTMMMSYAESVSKQYERMVHDEERRREITNEIFDKLESLRSKVLERDMAKEKHEKDIEIKERITDVVVPLAAAIGSKFTKGRLPAPDTREILLIQIAKAMTEKQLDIIQQIAADKWPKLRQIIDLALNDQADVHGFIGVARSFTPEQIAGFTQCLNMGQQAAIQELLSETNGSGGN